MGIGSLQLKNTDLLFKWCWKILQEDGGFWASICKELYHPRLANGGIVLRSRRPSTILKDILATINDGSGEALCLMENVNWKVGKGNCIKF